MTDFGFAQASLGSFGVESQRTLGGMRGTAFSVPRGDSGEPICRRCRRSMVND